jgi:hypothetical protein
MSNVIKYRCCCECSWAVSTEEHTREELNALVVEHAITTGHDVETALIHPDIDPPRKPHLN